MLKRLMLASAILPVVSFAESDPLDVLLKKLEEKGVITKEEAKEVKKVAKKHPHLKVKIRLQPRIDFGDIYKENNDYKSRSDFYFRRVRLEISKEWKNIPFGKKLKINFTLHSDKGERDYDYKKGEKEHHSFDPKVKYAYADWTFVDEFAVRIGKKKIPYSRVSLTSSSRQLLIERPYVTEDAKKWLGDYDSNQIMFHGKVAGGIFRYMLSIWDGSTIESKNKTGGTVKADTSLGDAYAIRLEFSPPGFVEKKKDDTGIGEKNKGDVISVGLNYAKNSDFDITDKNIKNEEATVWGGDIFGRFHLGPGALVAQAEYVKMKYDKLDLEEKGYYIQAGYLIPTPYGKFEPAARYEHFKQEDKKNDVTKHKKDIITLGFNHYIKGHKIKWGYNVLFIDNKEKDEKDQTVHQIQMQFYF